MPKYVFSLGLIPVQEWIGQARRSRDLRVGSVILSQIMARLLAHLEEKLQPVDIILPVPRKGVKFETLAKQSLSQALESPYGIPNRATGTCESEPLVLRTLEDEVVQKYWKDLMHASLQGDDSLGVSVSQREKEFWRLVLPALRIHLDDREKCGDCPFRLIWVAKPTASEAPKDILKEIDQYYLSLKRTRPLPFMPATRPVGKCNQCGCRDGFGPHSDFKEWRDFHERLSKTEWVKRGYPRSGRRKSSPPLDALRRPTGLKPLKDGAPASF